MEKQLFSLIVVFVAFGINFLIVLFSVLDGSVFDF